MVDKNIFLKNEQQIVKECRVDNLNEQYNELIKNEKYTQASRILNLLKATLKSEEDFLNKKLIKKIIIITSKPELELLSEKVCLILKFTTFKEFINDYAFRMILYLKQFEVDGILLKDITVDLEILEYFIRITEKEGKTLYLFEKQNSYIEDTYVFYKQFIEDIPWGNSIFPTEYCIIIAEGKCNLKCKMCPQANSSSKLRIMEMDTYKKAVDAIPDNIEIKVSITPLTEPFLIPDLMDKIKYLKKTKPLVNATLNTNGVLLNNKVIDDLIASKLDALTISLNMFNKNDFEWFTGVNKFDVIEENIKKLSRRKKETGAIFPQVILQYLNIPKNIPYIEKNEHQKLKQYVDSISLRGLSNWGGVIDIKNDITTKNFNNHYCRKELPCISLWNDLVIDWNGAIYPCCAVLPMKNKKEFALGNVQNDSVQDIWNGEALKELRLKQLLNEEVICKECGIYEETGDFICLILNEKIKQIMFHL
ncbi:MAG: radical SAM protein [Desulfamplus sp.]|nr:radical SAM protein [Desulfamplus sp.]